MLRPDSRLISTLHLPNTEEVHFRPMFPAVFPVPQFHRFDHAAIAGKIDRARRSARRNAIADDEFLMRTVMEVHDDAFEENFAAFDAQLDGAEAAIMFADVNIVVILSPVNVSVAEIIPAL